MSEVLYSALTTDLGEGSGEILKDKIYAYQVMDWDNDFLKNLREA